MIFIEATLSLGISGQYFDAVSIFYKIRLTKNCAIEKFIYVSLLEQFL